MTLPRTRRFACLLVPAVFGLAACGAAPQPATEDAAQTQPVEDTQTRPSEAGSEEHTSELQSQR